MDQMGYKVIVTGLVQGVCFRFSTAQQARQLNIGGHAKNLSDGSVEVIMFGEEAQCLLLQDFLEKGPQRAVVEDLDIVTIPYQNKRRFLTY